MVAAAAAVTVAADNGEEEEEADKVNGDDDDLKKDIVDNDEIININKELEKYKENINKLKRKIKEIQEEDRNNQELRYKKKIMEVEDLEKKILKVQNQEMELINNESLPKELFVSDNKIMFDDYTSKCEDSTLTKDDVNFENVKTLEKDKCKNIILEENESNNRESVENNIKMDANGVSDGYSSSSSTSSSSSDVGTDSDSSCTSLNNSRPIINSRKTKIKKASSISTSQNVLKNDVETDKVDSEHDTIIDDSIDENDTDDDLVVDKQNDNDNNIVSVGSEKNTCTSTDNTNTIANNIDNSNKNIKRMESETEPETKVDNVDDDNNKHDNGDYCKSKIVEIENEENDINEEGINSSFENEDVLNIDDETMQKIETETNLDEEKYFDGESNNDDDDDMEILKNIDNSELEIINNVISKNYVKSNILNKSKEKVVVEQKYDECKSNLYFGVDLFYSKLYEELAPPKTPSPTRKTESIYSTTTTTTTVTTSRDNIRTKSSLPSTSTPLKNANLNNDSKIKRLSRKDLYDVEKEETCRNISTKSTKQQHTTNNNAKLQIPKTPSPSYNKNINSDIDETPSI